MNNWNSGAGNALPNDTPGNVRKFTSTDINNATNNFYSSIGKGGFGTVYKGTIHGTPVAVKKLKDPEDRDFIAELKTLTRFQHENLLSIIGYCDDRTCPSIVLEYMPNGSLADRLKDKSKPLSWNVRLKIAYGAALGINHLHTSGKKPMVHRDIKSANILLNENFVPKVADFGFVRDGDSGLSQIEEVTKNLCYTRHYYAPEVLEGDVSVKLDTFSFGVVLLELLTGLPPYHEKKPLRKYAKRVILGRLLDSRAGWNKTVAEKLYIISKRCLKLAKKTRPTISEILGDLKCLSDGANVPSVSGITLPPPADGDDASSTENSSYYASSTENSSYYTSSVESSTFTECSEETDSSDDESSEENTYTETRWENWQSYNC